MVKQLKKQTKETIQKPGRSVRKNQKEVSAKIVKIPTKPLLKKHTTLNVPKECIIKTETFNKKFPWKKIYQVMICPIAIYCFGIIAIFESFGKWISDSKVNINFAKFVLLTVMLKTDKANDYI